MRVLVLGSEGSTGKRYVAILRMLGAEVETYDIQHFRNNRKYPRGLNAIVATPTHLHYTHCRDLLKMGYKKILVEKPFSRSVEEIQSIIDISGDSEISVVCNWKFSFFNELKHGSHVVSYNYFNHGNEKEPIWDLCQLLYLNDGLRLDFSCTSPFFTVTVDGFQISLSDMEKSYYRMLTSWIATPEKMWTLLDALRMTEKCNKYLDP